MAFCGVTSRRSTAALLLSTVGQLAPSFALEDAPTVSDDDLLILQLRLGRFLLSDGLIGYQTDDGACIDLGDLVRALDFAIEAHGDTASGWFLHEDNTFKLDTVSKTVEINGESEPIGAKDLFNSYGEVCISLKAISKWFPVRLELDFENAILFAESSIPLPVEEREARKKRRKQLRTTTQSEGRMTKNVDSPYKWSRWPTADLAFNVDATERKTTTSGDILATSEIAKLSTEIYASADSEQGLTNVRGRFGRQSAAGDIGPLDLTAFVVGDVSAPQTRLSAASRTGRGAFVSNYALHQPDVFDSTTLRGELPQGWEVELYRNDVLLEAQTARSDGRYEFVGVPVLFGRNEIKLVFYGPQGQVREEYKDLFVGESLVPKKQKRAYLAITQQDKATIYEKRPVTPPGAGTLRVQGRIDYGVSKSLSVGVGVSSLTIGDDRHTYIDGSLRTNIGKAGVFLDGSVDLTGGAATSAALQMGGKNLSLTASHEEFFAYASELTPQSGNDTIKRRNLARLDVALSPIRNTALPVSLALNHQEFSSGARSVDGAMRTSMAVGPVTFSNEINGVWRKLDSVKTVELSGTSLFNYFAGPVGIRGEVRYGVKPRKELVSTTLTADLRANEKFGARLEATYNAQDDMTTLGVGINRDFDLFAISAVGRYSTDNSFSVGVSATLSLLRNPTRGEWRTSSFNAARSGAVLARPFIDNDHNNVFSEGDSPLPDAQILVNRHRTRREREAANGVLISGFEAYSETIINVDMKTVDDPYLIKSASEHLAVISRPGVIAVIDLPLSRSGEIVGSTLRQREDAYEGIGDVELDLLDENGDVVSETTSEYDGFFVFEKVPYGAYTIRTDPDQSARLNFGAARSELLNVSQENDVIEGVSIKLKQLSGSNLEPSY